MELKQLIERAFYRPPSPPETLGQALVERIVGASDDRRLVDELLELVEHHPTNEELCIDVLPQLTVSQPREGSHVTPIAADRSLTRFGSTEWIGGIARFGGLTTSSWPCSQSLRLRRARAIWSCSRRLPERYSSGTVGGISGHRRT
jgi:hypothetical protein